ncbi:hypothetical protein CSH63_05265 [Micromonospora tulbaghiae]|uniref:Uncharacterized protein n=1 Tax=Micromonospora tulbaghiae TaxID=479978 RepID=A0A386WH99_9ACTN|nr:hypothetical protein CSH63_05265 [Micromonospora tulbaghiae]
MTTATDAGWDAEKGRMRFTCPAHRLTVAALTGTTLLVFTTPAAALYLNLLRLLRPHTETTGPIPTVHTALLHGPYWANAPAWLIPTLTFGGALLAVVTVSLTIWRRPSALPQLGVP